MPPFQPYNISQKYSRFQTKFTKFNVQNSLLMEDILNTGLNVHIILAEKHRIDCSLGQERMYLYSIMQSPFPSEHKSLSQQSL